MQLLTSNASPFSLKVYVAAHELGLADRMELIETHVRPHERNHEILDLNPLAQVPTLILDNGQTLHDSRVICEYLNDLAGGELIPSEGEARWRALTRQSVADGMLSAALIARYERVVRPEALRWQAWLEGHIDKISTGMRSIEADLPHVGDTADIGAISTACVIAYINFRFPDLAIADRFPALNTWYLQFSERPSMRAKSLS